MYHEQNVYQKNNPVFRWLMFLSLIVIFLTLLISWLLWFFLYQNTINSLLDQLTFKTFSILILSISGLAFLFAIPSIFLIRKTTISNIFSLLSFLLALVIIGGTYFLYSHLYVSIWIKNDFVFIFEIISKFLVLFLPWIITILATAFLFVNSLLNLIVTKEHGKKKSSMTQAEIKNQIPLIQIVNQTTDNEKLINNIANDKLSIPGPIHEINSEVSITEAFLKNTKEKIKSENPTIVSKLTKKEVKEVWEQGKIIPGVNKDLYRKDYAGAWIFFAAYIANPDPTTFNFQSYSWTIVDHKALSERDNNDIITLKPMNVLNALSKGENKMKWTTKVSSRGNENILKEQVWSD